MNCKDCGRPLQQGEDKYCPHCRNKRNKNVKTAATVGGSLLGIIAVILGAVFGNKNKKNKS